MARSLENLDLVASGKVREVYETGDDLLMVASDRISIYDVIMPNAIPDKGRVLTGMSAFWFDRTSSIVPNHMISIEDVPDEVRGRAMLVRRLEMYPVECVVRGYLSGSGWREYQETGGVCGIALPEGLQQCDKLPEPIFTPAFKNAVGHDENCTFAQAAERVGFDLMDRLQAFSLAIYNAAAERSLQRGLVLADTKFEFGFALDASGAPTDRLLLADEVLTPDSSRYWMADTVGTGREPASLDKQFLRDWLLAEEAAGRWNRQPPGPTLPPDIVRLTRERYERAAEMLAAP